MTSATAGTSSSASSPRRRGPGPGTNHSACPRRSSRSRRCSTTPPPLARGGARKPGGALACFAGGAVADGLFELSDEEIVARFAEDLISVYPQLEGKLGIVRRHRRVVPFWAPGRRASLPTLRHPLGPIHLAGDYQSTWPATTSSTCLRSPTRRPRVRTPRRRFSRA
ncbi:FAD-dependent oxidoreductase [Streptomyces eurythermus]